MLFSTLLALPLGISAIYSNSTSSAVDLLTDASTSPAAVEASTSLPSAIGVAAPAAATTSGDDLTTYVTVALGKTLTVTTKKASATAAPTSAVIPPVAGPVDDDLTTYVTVELGKTMTIVTRNQSNPTVAMANAGQTAAVGGAVAAVAGIAALFI